MQMEVFILEQLLNKALADTFLKLLEDGKLDGNRSTQTQICHLQKELAKNLSSEQAKELYEIDNLIASSETEKLEVAFRLGFLEGMKAGAVMFS